MIPSDQEEENYTEPSVDKKQNYKRKGVFLIPNLFTTAGLFCGFYAIVAAMAHNYEAGSIAIFIAMCLDGLDGRIARYTNTQTDFGAEYDSLADLVSFGLAPSLMVYSMCLSSYGKLGWLVSFIYTAGAALRLARFNTQVGIADKRYFQGLSSPSAAAVLASFVWTIQGYTSDIQSYGSLMMFLTFVTGLLMVSNIRYHSFKELNLKNRKPFYSTMFGVLVLAFISLDPAPVLLICFLTYAISGPVLTLMEIRQKRINRNRNSLDE